MPSRSCGMPIPTTLRVHKIWGIYYVQTHSDIPNIFLASPTELEALIAAQGSARRPLDAVHGAGLGNVGPINLSAPMPREIPI